MEEDSSKLLTQIAFADAIFFDTIVALQSEAGIKQR